MSGLWNPFAFGVTGQPVGPQTDALRVYGAEPSKEQLAMAQQTFAKFCMTARLSAVPNPMEQGFLPDGSKYRIVTVGNVRIMEVRVEGADGSEEWLSGIVITLTNLDGSSIPAHSVGGVPITYILTPKTKDTPKDSRIATGEWIVRELKGPSGGGKAVQTNAAGDKYFTSVGPKSKAFLPYGDQSDGFTNRRAYFAEEVTGWDTYYHGLNVGDGGTVPIAFVLTDGDDSYAARVIIDPGELSDRASASLYIGEWTNGPPATGKGLLGPFVDSVTLPEGSTIVRSSPTIKPDGSKIRLLVVRDGKQCAGTLNITKTSISYTAGACATPGVPNHQTISPEIYEGVQGETWYGDDGANVLWGGRHLSWWRYGTGDEWHSEDASGLTFGFGPRGEEVFATPDGGSFTQIRADTRYTTDENYSIINYNHYPPTTGGFWDRSEAVTGMMRQTMTLGGIAEFALAETSKEILVREEVWQYDVSSHGEVGGTLGNSTITWSNQGGGEGHYIEYDLFYTPLAFGEIYWERFLKFAIYTEFHGQKQEYSWTYTPGDNASVTRTNSPVITTPSISYLVVKHGGSFLMKREITNSTRRYLVYVASDPKTSAILVNLLAVEGPDRTPVESWLYLVDDARARLLNTVMPDIPANAMARSNADLYTL